MTDDEKKAFRDGYRIAIKEALDDLANIHGDHKNNLAVRKVVDLVWAKLKGRLNHSKSEGFKINGA